MEDEKEVEAVEVTENEPTVVTNIDKLIQEQDEMRKRIFDLEHDVKVRDDEIAELKAENYRIKVTSGHSKEYYEEVKDEPQINTETKAFDDFINEY